MRFPTTVLFLFLLLPGPESLAGQEGAPPPVADPGESLQVSLLTVGQGDLYWERFGHNGLLFVDEESGEETVFHWGVFNFHQEDFFPRLAKGTMLYSMDDVPLDEFLLQYRHTRRSVWIQELNLTPRQRMHLYSAVRENALPGNREYRYDYYRDNCSTRVRDHLDRVLGARIEARFSGQATPWSFRWHTRRILQEMPPYYLGIQFVLGPNGDRPISFWEEMFLPRALKEGVREVEVPDGQGGTRPLVSAERMILDPGRPPPPADVPFAFPFFLLAGLLWGGSFFWLAARSSKLTIVRRFGILILGGGWTLVATAGGTLLLAAWLFTDHFFWYANYNLFQVNPLFLPLVLAFPFFLFSGRFPGWARNLAAFLGFVAVAGLVLELLPGLGQRNAEILGFTLPMNLALWAGSGCLHARCEGAGRDPADESS
jgi:hypothetical protein